MFTFYRPAMPDERPLTPADPADLAHSLAHYLQFDGRRHHHRADGFMAHLMAEHLMKCMEQSGYVVMKKPPADQSKSMPWGPPGKGHLTE